VTLTADLRLTQFSINVEYSKKRSAIWLLVVMEENMGVERAGMRTPVRRDGLILGDLKKEGNDVGSG